VYVRAHFLLTTGDGKPEASGVEQRSTAKRRERAKTRFTTGRFSTGIFGRVGPARTCDLCGTRASLPKGAVRAIRIRITSMADEAGGCRGLVVSSEGLREMAGVGADRSRAPPWVARTVWRRFRTW